MKLTLASAKPIGLLIGTAISSALSGAIAGRAAAGQHIEAQPTISAPALTTADVVGLRTDMRELQVTITSLNGRLSRLEGIDEAKARARE